MREIDFRQLSPLGTPAYASSFAIFYAGDAHVLAQMPTLRLVKRSSASNTVISTRSAMEGDATFRDYKTAARRAAASAESAAGC